jgi:autotransporter-associated beta strand protein
MKFHLAFPITIAATLFSATYAVAQDFIPTSGTHSWNVDSNWDSDPNPFPNSNTADVTFLPATTTEGLNVNLGEPITVNSLTVLKGSSGTFNTTIGEGTQTLSFDGGTPLIINTLSLSTGQTIFNAPIAFTSTLQVDHNDVNALSFNQSLTGSGATTGLTINRGTPSSIVVLGAANSYTGTTSFTNSLNNQNYLLVRLNDANAIPGGIGATGGTSDLLLTGSVIIGLSASDFNRSVGTGPTQFRLANNSANVGWAAFGQDRAVKVTTGTGTPDQLIWGSSGINLGTLVLGHSLADKTLDMQNSLVLTTGTGSVSRTIRIANGAAAVDAIISGPIINTQGTANLTLTGSSLGDGTVNLTAANTYNGTTTYSSGVTVRLENAAALPGGNLTLAGNGVLGLGVGNDSFTRSLGTGPNQIQLTNGGGFAAFGGNKTVNLGGTGATVTWGAGNFLQSASSLTLGDTNSDSTLDFQNGIDLSTAGNNRTILTPNGTATVDGKVSGVITGGGNLRKNNPGTLELSNANTYTGTTLINAGTLLLTNATSIPGGIAGGNTGGIVFTNDVENPVPTLGLGQGDFTSELNSAGGAGQINLNGSTSGTTTAGFAAYGANRIVNFKTVAGSVTQQIVWGTGGFVTGVLGFSDGDADAMVDLQNPIDLNGAARRVKVANGDANIDGTLSGVISGTAASFEKDGSGTLALTAANTYDGGTTVIGGRLLVNNTSGSGTGSGPVNVNSGTLGGTGIIQPSGTAGVTIASGATLSPGESIGTLTLNGSTTTSTMLTLAAGATIFAELNIGQSDQAALINGATGDIAFNNNVINFSDATLGGLAPGAYALFTADVADAYSGLVTGSGGGPITSGLSIGTGLEVYGSIAELWSLGNDITLIINSPDFNGNLVVDAADYVLWRQNPAAYFGDAGYTFWRRWFGLSAAGSGNGDGLGGAGSVPEPTAFVMLYVLISVIALQRFHFARG